MAVASNSWASCILRSAAEIRISLHRALAAGFVAGLTQIAASLSYSTA